MPQKKHKQVIVDEDEHRATLAFRNTKNLDSTADSCKRYVLPAGVIIKDWSPLRHSPIPPQKKVASWTGHTRGIPASCCWGAAS